MVSTKIADLESIAVDLKSGNLVNSWIGYPGRLGSSTSLFRTPISNPKLHSYHSLDLDQYVSDFMYVGFSGSTQGSTEIHSINWWSFSSNFEVSSKSESSSPPPVSSSSSSSTPPPTATLMNPTADSINPPPPSQPPSQPNSTLSHTTEKTSKCHNQLCKDGPGAVVGVVTAGAFFLAFCAVVLIWVYSKKFKNLKNSDPLTSEIIKMPKEFSYKELKSATKCFNSARIIGHGAFGTVYRGILPESGGIVADSVSDLNGMVTISSISSSSDDHSFNGGGGVELV
ncbi:L-type lectin-domain containing receptor kinase VIII.1 [Camellia lanceoleosa]|uniref:L-type lectin-domain containing receptor kinase VIII.1 n=1 Tax=Camellia lanceoleosa TaxID=1840588 RepID=A0ACC0HUD1_9ERIC|nr:L-type lectin-domain containing receptor kinase VIII.1 [Camellia lanceoleosa]